MIYAYVALALAIFGGGFASGYRFELSNTQRLELAIQRSNAEGELILQAAKLKVADADIQAEKRNQQIEIIHVQNLATVNGLVDRVRGASRQDCANPLPANKDSSVSNSETADYSRLERFAQLAGKSATYAESCWKELTENNCGIAK